MGGRHVIRVALVDDQEIIREGLAAILESQPDIRVVLQGGDGIALLDGLRAGTLVDVALVDIRMPRMDGLEAARRVAALACSTVVVILTTFGDDDYVLEALRAGAAGFLLKRCTRDELIGAVRAAADGDAMLSPQVTRSVIARMLTGGVPDPAGLGPAHLTARELDVLQGIGRGDTNAEIARTLHLSESTVKTHVSNVLAKTSSRDRVGAALFAVRTGVV
jgi:DNA-binding NarL/FixJ family response regulator